MRTIQSLLRRPLGMLTALGLAAAFAAACYAVAPVAEPSSDNDLDGKVLYIVTKNRTYGITVPYTIEKAKCRRSGSHTFLVGTVVDANGKKPAPRTVGSTVWVAMEEIEAIYPFKDVPEMRKRCPRNVFLEGVPPGLVPAGPVPLPAPAAPPPPAPKRN